MPAKRKRVRYEEDITSVGHNDDMPFDLEDEEDYGLVNDAMDQDWEDLDSLDDFEDEYGFDDEEEDLLDDSEE